eukprot:CAMPEP_0173388264 /NCGR_PEP_ID=MMETSP1356-20130122/10616_1 /TAXON_ID=77927 ORGANISM="Hemiselmis virescens, Strain PCC157" /NCGR_SAMPLE_ID=MMETSP1356 /ASSEMBLY_ACC=CAM_ASM_000847 /LENGTH=252 /DNA_ID=CAMNT_0014345125 /DNA_START=220 /DNA_END=975 /DNA_ORIENTATION=+
MAASPPIYLEAMEWDDTQPIPQDDGPDPVVLINYSVEFVEVMGYLRAVLEKNEKSPRALSLTERVIGLNAANYTVWGFRRECIDALGLDWADELLWVTELAPDNPKNYQIWHHRRCCLKKLGGHPDELEFLDDFLTDEDLDDGKNYHAWAHRQWVIKEYNLWEGELAFLDRMLELDARNNSAYNQRFYVMKHTTDMSVAVREREIEWVLAQIAQIPNNDSAWAYLRGMAEGFSLSTFEPIKKAAAALCARDP